MQNVTRQDLLKVEKPARYVGGEYNQVLKQKENIKCRFAFCFPDVYDIGMSNLGMKILYNVLNKRNDTWCERVFAPWFDFEKIMREKDITLYGLESKDPINEFDIVGFTLQYEMSYTNILNMLNLSKIPILSKDRDKDYPFVIAGGPCASNPYPLSKFIDIFLLGDGEELINTVVEKYILWKEEKLPKVEFLYSIKDIQGVFIPSIHTKNDVIKKAVIEDLDKLDYPTNFVVPNMDIIQNRISLELFRGCDRGCRFCQAGYTYRPVRERSVDKILKLATESLKNTGMNEISLSSLSTGDYSNFNLLTNSLIDVCKEKNVNISLPSLRVDSVDNELARKLKEFKNNSVTIAPEAGSQRLRNVINKNITEEDILNSCRTAFSNGSSSIKLYFMIGLPTETYEDIEAIVTLANKIVEEYYKIPKELRNGKCLVTVSTSTFVPKPHTPFEWFAQNTIDKIELKQQFLKEKIKGKNLKFNWHNPNVSMLEAVISRGDNRICDLIHEAYKNGAKFDSFGEKINMDAWNKAFKTTKIDPKDYANKEYGLEYEFPWDNIMHGVNKEFLIREYNKAISSDMTNRCSESCSACGVTNISKCKFVKVGDIVG